MHAGMKVSTVVVLIIVVLTTVGLILSADSQMAVTSLLTEYAEKQPFLGILALFSLIVLGIVAAPLTILPLIPLSAAIIGPLTTALVSIAGFTIGGLISFLLARHFGRPLLARLVDLNTVATYEAMIPSTLEMPALILLRLVLPVDVLSYAIGFVSSINVKKYIIGTAIGVTPFSLIFSYSGDSFMREDFILLSVLSVFGLFIFFGALYFLQKILQ